MFKTRITPNISDTDALRYINSTVIPVWFENGKNEVYTIFNPTHELTYKKWNLMLVHMDLNFIKPIYFGYDVEIRTYIIKLGKNSITLLQEVWQNGQLRVNGKSVLIFFDYIRQETKNIPEDIRNIIQKELISIEEIEENNKKELKKNRKNKIYEFIESE